MSEVQKATLRLEGDASHLQRTMKRARSATAKLGRKMGRIAKRIGKVMATAFAAAGGAAVKFAADFEKSTTRLETLVGLSGERVATMREEILQLAPAVGKSATALSEALFDITSAGLRGEKAMNLLRQTAKASVVGLGNMRQIADAATSAMNAFGAENLSAQEAVDQMLVTVRKGKLPPEQLAGSLSKVVGIASQVGVSFSEVNSFIATFTRLGAEARVAATSLRQVLSSVIKPGNKARETFRKIGSSIGEFRDEIQEKGLTTALIDLIQAQEGNLDVIGQLIPDVRALSGVLSTAGAQADTFASIQRSLQDAVGATDEAFEKANKTLSQLGGRVLQSVKVGLIRVAREFFPEIKSFARFLQNNMGKAFAAVIRGVKSLLETMRLADAKLRGNALMQIAFGLEPTPESEALARIDELRRKLRDLNSELIAATQGVPAGGATRTGIGGMARDAGDLAERIQTVSGEINDLRSEVTDGPLASRLEQLASRLEGMGTAASSARGPVQDLKDDVRKLGEQIVGLIPRLDGLMSAATGGGGGGGAPRLPDASGLRNVGRGPAQIIRGAGFDPAALEGFMRRSGEDAGKDFSEGMEETLKRGARRAMESLLRGLFEGRDSILDAVANIGLSIGSALATDGIMSALDIGSPSRVARNIGEQVGLGLIQGMRSMEKATVRAGRSLARSAAVGGASVAGAGAGGGSSVVQGASAAGVGGGDTFHNKIEFNVQAMDAQSFRDFARSRGRDAIVEAVSSATRESIAARNAVLGQG